MSCSTNARRSAGDSVSSTTSSASPTESASSASCSGSASSPVRDDRLGQPAPHVVLAPCAARAQHVEAHAGDDGRQPAAEVGDRVRVGAAQAQPRLLHGVVGLAQRAEHPVGDRAQVRAVLLELLGLALRARPRSHPPVAVRHSSDEPTAADVTAPPARNPGDPVHAIEVDGLRKTYPGGVEAVKGIDFEVAPGEVFGLLGPNGAGKSTTIGMLTTTIVPTAGTRPPRRLRRGAPAARRPARRAASSSRRRSSTAALTRPARTSSCTRACGASRAPRGRARIAELVEALGLGDAGRPPGRDLQRRRAAAARDRPRARLRAARAVPRRADRRPRPAHPPRAARRDRRPARRATR